MPVRKKRRRDQPHKVLHLTTYRRLQEYLGAFAQGHFHLLILVGAGGLAKSRSVRAVLDGKACWIEGKRPHLACTPSFTGTVINSSSSTTSMPSMRIAAGYGY
jgi:hypothetical protein